MPPTYLAGLGRRTESHNTEPHNTGSYKHTTHNHTTQDHTAQNHTCSQKHTTQDHRNTQHRITHHRGPTSRNNITHAGSNTRTYLHKSWGRGVYTHNYTHVTRSEAR